MSKWSIIRVKMTPIYNLKLMIVDFTLRFSKSFWLFCDFSSAKFIVNFSNDHKTNLYIDKVPTKLNGSYIKDLLTYIIILYC